MMHNDSSAILDDLLSRWHFHCRFFNTSVRSADPMFKNALRAKGEQTVAAISEDQWEAGAMKAIDNIVFGDKQGQGGMVDPHRAAALILARNCYTGRSVWISPRLPADREERAVVVLEARNMLTRRLMAAGVI